MKNLTRDTINKAQKDNNVKSISQSDLIDKVLTRTQVWLEKVSSALPEMIHGVFRAPIKMGWIEARLVQGAHVKYCNG